ncbi:dephospho-CoA kinase [Micromonospora endophytica]|uniref:Dephospho-CoA kinase n=1 Tax=Micromonospora endophytica TaxID=515350 RepID=A0A2W2CRC8_9ACTN|nr:dephospho-CoA kinase [Micromonospora endophytica]PZF94188.1 dephospho-CoA kinase [Micromonospora endophytica]RIW41698.1 dephospho-CoA kinase [Micromonospora endophytica]BCJ56598.1 adenylate kinase [Micromonospora endophytica]
MTAADRVADWARDRPPRAGRTRVLAIEGRSGAGKSSLADAVADQLDATLLRMDDLYPGWDGLRAGAEALRAWVLEPLARSPRTQPPARPEQAQLAAARWRKWDWAASRYGPWQPLPDRGWLVVEGVGSGARDAAPYLSGIVWVEAPTALRRARALARDGDTYAPHWARWAAQETEFHTAEDLPGRADLIIDNSTGTPDR